MHYECKAFPGAEGGETIKIFDSHCHLNDPQFERDLEQVIERAREKGVSNILIPGYDLPSSIKAIEIAEKYDFICSVGLHPHDAKKFGPGTLREFERLIKSSPKVVAIGEVGLDFYKNYSPRETQIEVFETFLHIAVQHCKPVILHVRDAYSETLEILEGFIQELPSVIFHCYSGGVEDAFKILSKPNTYISFSGTITYKSPKLAKVAELTPLDRILVETDAPYLTPSKEQGRNEPSYILHTVIKLSTIKQQDVTTIAHQTYNNTLRAFNLLGDTTP